MPMTSRIQPMGGTMAGAGGRKATGIRVMPRTINRLLLGLAVGSAVPYALYTRKQPWISTFHRARRKVGPPPKRMTGRREVVGSRLLLEGVLYLLAGIFQAVIPLVELAFIFGALVVGDLAGSLFGLAAQVVNLVADLVSSAHRGSLLFLLIFTLWLPRQRSNETW